MPHLPLAKSLPFPRTTEHRTNPRPPQKHQTDKKRQRLPDNRFDRSDSDPPPHRKRPAFRTLRTSLDGRRLPSLFRHAQHRPLRHPCIYPHSPDSHPFHPANRHFAHSRRLFHLSVRNKKLPLLHPHEKNSETHRLNLKPF